MAALHLAERCFRLCSWKSYTDIFSIIWTKRLLFTTQNIVPVLANSFQLLCGQWVARPTETTRRCDVIGLVTTLHGNPPEKPTVKTAGTLCQCCMFCNCMEYSAAWYVFIVGNTELYRTNWFSVKVTAVALVNTLVLELGMGLGTFKVKR